MRTFCYFKSMFDIAEVGETRRPQNTLSTSWLMVKPKRNSSCRALSVSHMERAYAPRLSWRRLQRHRPTLGGDPCVLLLWILLPYGTLSSPAYEKQTTWGTLPPERRRSLNKERSYFKWRAASTSKHNPWPWGGRGVDEEEGCSGGQDWISRCHPTTH